jgi:hypothetical protein
MAASPISQYFALLFFIAGSTVDDIPAFLYEMGLVLQLRGDSWAAGTQYGRSNLLAASASRLAAFALSMQWVHVTRILLPLTVATGRTPSEVVAEMDASLPNGELPG